MARRKNTKITEDELKNLIGNHITTSESYYGGTLSQERERAVEYYLGSEMGNEIEGRSQVISSDTADAVESLMAQLMKIFTASNQLFRAEPVGAEDIEVAKQASDYINHIFYKKNEGWVLLHNMIKDALIEKNGFLKIYWEKSDKVEREEYESLDDEQFTELVADDDVEVIEHTETIDTDMIPEGIEVDADGMMQIPSPPMQAPDGMMIDNGMMQSVPAPKKHDIVVHRTIRNGQVRIDGIPPEEFLIESRAKSINTANFVAQRCRKTRGELLELGFDKDIVETIPSAYESEYNSEEEARHDDTDRNSQKNNLDYATQEVEIYECYVKCDYEGKGKAELRKVTVAGNNGAIMLDDEPYDTMPFVSLTPIIMPHRFYGRSIAEMVEDVQTVKSFIMRSINDNIYGLSNNRLIVNDSLTNISDILTNRPNMIVRVKGSPQEAVSSLPAQPINDIAFPILKYYDELKEQRTGVSKTSMGLNTDALNSQTSTGLNQVMNSAQSRIEFFARTFANTGIKDLGKKIFEVVVKHQDKDDVVMVTNKFIAYKPYEWRDRCNITITSGLGSGNEDRKMLFLNNILERQIQALRLQGNPEYPLVNLDKIFTTLQRMVETAGMQDAEQFFLDPSTQELPQPQPKPPTEFEKVSLAQIQGENQRKQADLKFQRDKMMLDFQKALLKFESDITSMEIQSNKDINQEEIKSRTKLAVEEMREMMKSFSIDAPEVQPQQQVNTELPKTIPQARFNLPK